MRAHIMVHRWPSHVNMFLHMAEGVKKFFGGLFYKEINFIQEISEWPSWPNHSLDLTTPQRPHIQISSHWSLDFNIWILWGGQKHSIYDRGHTHWPNSSTSRNLCYKTNWTRNYLQGSLRATHLHKPQQLYIFNFIIIFIKTNYIC